MQINTIIFDLGGVLIDWNPKYLYRKVFETEEEVDFFLENICTPEWNEMQDGGRTFADAISLLAKKHPEHKENIELYFERWEEMLLGEISGTVKILEQLNASGKYKLFALTNWSSETFDIALNRFKFLGLFEDILVSGVEKDLKPNLSFYQTMIERFSIDPKKSIFIDDRLSNIEGAKQLGIACIHYTNPENLLEALQKNGITL